VVGREKGRGGAGGGGAIRCAAMRRITDTTRAAVGGGLWRPYGTRGYLRDTVPAGFLCALKAQPCRVTSCGVPTGLKTQTADSRGQVGARCGVPTGLGAFSFGYPALPCRATDYDVPSGLKKRMRVNRRLKVVGIVLEIFCRALKARPCRATDYDVPTGLEMRTKMVCA
jgi:hypothetical protein